MAVQNHSMCKKNDCTNPVDTTTKSEHCGKHKARSGQHRKKFRADAIKAKGIVCEGDDCVLNARGIPIEEYMLDVDHIKEVNSFPGDASVKEINHPDNAKLLCKICHAKKNIKLRPKSNTGK